MSQNKHVYGEKCIVVVKRRSALDTSVSRSERNIIEGYKFSFRENVGTITNTGDNKGDQKLF